MWVFSAGRWTLDSPAGRTALISFTPESTAADVDLYSTNPAHEIKIVRLSSGDGRWCFEAGIEGSNYVIRTVTAGVNFSICSNTAGGDDIPDATAANNCFVAHALPAGNQVIRMRVRLVAGRISLYINGSEDPVLSHALTADELADFGHNRYWGFASDVADARVTSPEIDSLEENITPRRDALVGVCGGGVYVTKDDTGPQLVRAGVFPPGSAVSMVAYQQVVRMAGGGRAMKLTMSTLALESWGDATGDGILPGATETAPSSGVYIPGTTRMTGLYNSGDRIGMFGDPQDPQNAFECEIGNAEGWNTGAVDEPGRAFALANELPGRVGEPIIGARELDANTVIFACRNSIWRKVGDPALGVFRLERVESAYGASGKDALAPVSKGSVMIHAPEGVVAVGSGGPAVPVSLDDLTDGLTITREDMDDYIVQVLRDPTRQLVDIFLTPVEEPDDFSISFSMCERTKKNYGNGWFAHTLPASMGPTASCVWNGREVLGTWDGYLIVKDNASKNDNGTAIDAKFPVILTVEGGHPDPDHEVVLSRYAFELGVETNESAASDRPTFAVYGGLTTEMGYAGTQRWPLIGSGLAPVLVSPGVRVVRSPAIVMEVSNGNDPDTSIRVEAIWAMTSLSARLIRRVPVAVTRPTPTRLADDLSHPGTTTPDGPPDGPGALPIDGTQYALPAPMGGAGPWFQSPFEIGQDGIDVELVPSIPPGTAGPPGGDPMSPPGGDIGGIGGIGGGPVHIAEN